MNTTDIIAIIGGTGNGMPPFGSTPGQDAEGTAPGKTGKPGMAAFAAMMTESVEAGDLSVEDLAPLMAVTPFAADILTDMKNAPKGQTVALAAHLLTLARTESADAALNITAEDDAPVSPTDVAVTGVTPAQTEIAAPDVADVVAPPAPATDDPVPVVNAHAVADLPDQAALKDDDADPTDAAPTEKGASDTGLAHAKVPEGNPASEKAQANPAPVTPALAAIVETEPFSEAGEPETDPETLAAPTADNAESAPPITEEPVALVAEVAPVPEIVLAENTTAMAPDPANPVPAAPTEDAAPDAIVAPAVPAASATPATPATPAETDKGSGVINRAAAATPATPATPATSPASPAIASVQSDPGVVAPLPQAPGRAEPATAPEAASKPAAGTATDDAAASRPILAANAKDQGDKNTSDGQGDNSDKSKHTPATAAATSSANKTVSAFPPGLTVANEASAQFLGQAGPINPFLGILPIQSSAPVGAGQFAATNGTSLTSQSLPASEQVAVQISKAVKEGTSQFTMKLNPPEMGRIDIKLDIAADNTVRVHIVVDSREVLDLLQRDSSSLERTLNGSGLKTDSGNLEFSLRQEAQQHRLALNEKAGKGGDDADGTATDGQTDDPGADAPFVASNRALDIQV